MKIRNYYSSQILKIFYIGRLKWAKPLQLSLVLLVFFSVLNISASVEAKSKNKPKSWEVLFKQQNKNLNKRKLPKKMSLKILNDVQLEGVNTKDPFLFNDFHSSGIWGLSKGRLAVTAGSDTMLRLSSAEDFQLEGIMNAEGLGGWYILFGWKNERGFMLYNVTYARFAENKTA